MPEDNDSWGLATRTWERVCDVVEPVTAVPRPYERVRITNPPDEDGFHATVQHPWPGFDSTTDTDTSDTASENEVSFPDIDWENRPKNEYTRLPDDLHTTIETRIQEFRDSGFTITSEGVDVVFDSVLYTRDGAGAAVFYVTRHVEDNELYQQFQELMHTLGYVDTPNDVVDGRRVTPREDSLSDHPVDIGMEATAYKMIPNPHEYWSNCDTLDDYIDMRVEHGGDRAELEAQDEYRFHFHPDTRIQSLSTEQQTAVQDWSDAVTSVVEPRIDLEDTVIWSGVTRVDVADDATISVEYSVHVGDVIEEPDNDTFDVDNEDVDKADADVK